MRKAISSNGDNLQKSRRGTAKKVDDLNFADDIALLEDDLAEVQEIRGRFESETALIEPYFNADRTKIMVFNEGDSGSAITARDGTVMDTVDAYQGAWVENSKKESRARKALAWCTIHKMNMMRKSGLTRHIKERLFVLTVWL